MERVEAKGHSKANREAVWRLVSDGEDWATWGEWREAKLEREGNPPSDGIGAVRVLTSGRRGLNGRPVVSREEVVTYEPPERLQYKLLSGLPLRDYLGTITLADAADGGTEITWRSQFEGKIPLTGGLFRRGLQKFMEDAVQRLAREAERRSEPSP